MAAESGESVVLQNELDEQFAFIERVRRTVGIGAVKLADSLVSIFLAFVGHIGCSLGAACAVVAKLQPRNRANPFEEFLLSQ